MIALAYFTFGIPKATGTVNSLADSEALRAARITLLTDADLGAVTHAFKKEKFRIKPEIKRTGDVTSLSTKED